MKKRCVNNIENITIIINNFDGFENVFQVINNCILV